MVQEIELSSSQKTPVFMIGQDNHGNWVVQDRNGVRGGLFVDRAQALRFVRSETGNRFPAFVNVSGIFELKIPRYSDRAGQGQFAVQVLGRRVA